MHGAENLKVSVVYGTMCIMSENLLKNDPQLRAVVQRGLDVLAARLAPIIATRLAALGSELRLAPRTRPILKTLRSRVEAAFDVPFKLKPDGDN